jgi:hypothetical protein
MRSTHRSKHPPRRRTVHGSQDRRYEVHNRVHNRVHAVHAPGGPRGCAPRKWGQRAPTPPTPSHQPPDQTRPARPLAAPAIGGNGRAAVAQGVARSPAEGAFPLVRRGPGSVVELLRGSR